MSCGCTTPARWPTQRIDRQIRLAVSSPRSLASSPDLPRSRPSDSPPLAAAFRGATTPPSGDTTGYWQQRVHYRSWRRSTSRRHGSRRRADAHVREQLAGHAPRDVRPPVSQRVPPGLQVERTRRARESRALPESRRARLSATSDSRRRRRSTARRWSSTIRARRTAPSRTFELPRPLAPHDSIRIHFEWDARPSTVAAPTGAARPHVRLRAVVSRKSPCTIAAAGSRIRSSPRASCTASTAPTTSRWSCATIRCWRRPACRSSGDPGWARVSRTGAARARRRRVRERAAGRRRRRVPAGYRAVRFFANNVHHFAWSASPDYRYEGGDLRSASCRARAFPDVGHASSVQRAVSSRATTRRGATAARVDRTRSFALQWLESHLGAVRLSRRSRTCIGSTRAAPSSR